MQKNRPFTDFDLNSNLIATLENLGLTHATPIQEETIEPILAGEDIFAQAETGSGKTASFSIPIIETILRDRDILDDDLTDILYVILSPTRELAQQTHSVFSAQGQELGIQSICVIGGECIEKQKAILNSGPQIIVATPGRLCDLIKQESINLNKCQGIVFDEADRLFDMGFKNDIEFVLNKMPPDRQLIMVSATTNLDVLNTAYKFNSDPIEINISEDDLIVDNIDHKIAMITANEKMPLLVNLLRKHNDTYALIFCNTQIETHLVASWLEKMNFKAEAISGRLSQSKRTDLMSKFRSKEITILVCTDVAARGLDIKGVNLVINYDMPQEAANYVHRIGRTARAGESGEAISFCAPDDCKNVDAIYDLLNDTIPRMRLANDDFATDVCKRPYIDRKTLKVSANPPPRRIKKISVAERASNIFKNDRNLKQIHVIQAINEDHAINIAMNLFKTKYRSQIIIEKRENGRKRFFLIGKRLTKFHVTLQPTYKKIILPFVINLVQMINLKLYTKFSFDGKNIKINFTGADVAILNKENSELLKSIEHIARLFLFNTVNLPPNIKFNCFTESVIQTNRKLIEQVEQIASKVLKEKSPLLMPPLNPAERRLVHLHLENHPKLKTSSIGDGRYKRIQINLN